MKTEKNITGQIVVTNLLWRFAERWGAQGVSFIVSIVLARLLMPADYGIIAIVTVITSILNVFIDSGMANALIQKKNADDLDFSSVFYFNICFCTLLYMILFVMAPFIANAYNLKKLTSVLRVLGLTIVVSGLKNVQMSYVSKTMQFKKFFFSTLGGTISAAIIGILMAYFGFGVWALVAQQLVNTILDTIILWITVKWRPKSFFSFNRLKGLLSFGWKMLVSNLLDTIYNNIRTLIIGVMYPSKDLGLYNKGKSFPWLIIENINSTINSVLLPTMSMAQDNTETLKAMTRRSIKISIYIISPLMMGLFFVAKPLISLLLTDKWLLCVPYMRIFCITYMLYPIQTANLNAILANGRSDIFLKLEILKKIIGITFLLISMKINVMAIAYSLVITTIISTIINALPNKKLLNYGYREQIRDILPALLLSLFMGGVVLLWTFMDMNNILILICQVITGAVIYVLGSNLLKLESYTYIIDTIRSFKK